MSLNHSPSIVTNGLVFGYDQSSIRSYAGPAIRNLANGISFSSTGTATGYSSTGLVETVNIPELGPTTVYTNTIQNNYLSFTPNSGNCCPSLHSWGNFPVTPSTLYTYGIVYRCDSGYTHPNYMYRYEFTANGGSYVTESGVHSDANRVALGGGWFYAWGTFTTQSTTNWIGGAHTFYYRYFNLSDRLSVAKVLVAAGNWSGLHPKYWPDQATTRSNTQAILDATNTNTITATSLTYASDGTFSFNGSSNFITTNSPSMPTDNFTIELIVYPTSFSNSPIVICPQNAGIDQFIQFNTTGTFIFKMAAGGDVGERSYTSADACPVNNFSHIVCVKSGTNVALYRNGILTTSTTTDTTATAGWGSTTWSIGQRGNSTFFFSGIIPVVRAYSKGLTAAEVQQNFNALRGRYGL
jgi:hypothetical protein